MRIRKGCMFLYPLYPSETHYKTHLLRDEVNIKKYFYALRPLLAAKWILDKKMAPPMLFEELMEAELEVELVPEVSRLLDMKKNLPEMGKAPNIQSINDYIERELCVIEAAAEEIEEQAVEWDDLNKLFLRMVDIK